VARTLLEILVHIDVLAVRVTDLAETVHVELADEGGEVAMLEVDGEDVFGKLGDVLDIEGIGGGSPTDRVGNGLVLSSTRRTSSISTSLEMKIGVCALLPFLLRLRLILLL
jgi:hypothetical protein